MTARRLLTLHHLAAVAEDAGVRVRAAAVLPDGRLKLRVDRCPVVEAWLEGAAPPGWTATPYRSGALLMRAA